MSKTHDENVSSSPANDKKVQRETRETVSNNPAADLYTEEHDGRNPALLRRMSHEDYEHSTVN